MKQKAKIDGLFKLREKKSDGLIFNTTPANPHMDFMLDVLFI